MKVSFILLEMLRCFLITAVTEGAVGFIFKIRTLKEQFDLFLVNLLTNPLFVSLCYGVMLRFNKTQYKIFVLICEVFIFIVESLIFKFVLKPKINPFLLAFILNFSSFSVGIVINYLF